MTELHSTTIRAPAGAVEDESGAIILMATLVLLVMIGMSAVVVDLAFMRHDKRASQTAADMGAIAGAFALPLTPHSDASGLDGCQDAWAYVLENIPISDGAGEDPCLDPEVGDFTNGCTNDDEDLSPNVAVGEVDPYRVTITWPVSEDMVGAQQDDAVERPCELVAVHVQRTRGLFFAGIWGLSEGFTTAPAVASMNPGDATGIPALIVLDPHECHSLTADGKGKVWVEYFEAVNETDGDGEPLLDENGDRVGEGQPVFEGDRIVRYEDAPGLIGVDSYADGTCGSSQPYAMDAGTSGNTEIKAGVNEAGEFIEGDIWIYALSGPHASKAHRQSAVDEGRVAPQPSPVFRPITREPVDHRYNCGSPHFNTGDEFAEHPTIAPCEPGPDRGPFIDQLRDTYGDGGDGQPQDFISYSAYMEEVYGADFSDGDPCDLDDDGLIHLDPHHTAWNASQGTTGDDWAGWWIDCPGDFGLTDVQVVISGGDVVFEGGTSVGGQGGLYVNYDLDDDDPTEVDMDGRAEDIVVYIRSGDLYKVAQPTVAFHRAAVYLHDGRINLGGGAQHGELIWSAPVDGPFRTLAMWSESPQTHEMGGQPNLTLRGVFFAPNATMEFEGKGGQVNRANAQFLSFRLVMKGQGTLLLRPDPAEAIEVPLPGAELIR